jgi:molybdopterin synthase sulfur carrier subunit
LFASAREAAGRASDEVEAGTLGDALDVLRVRYGAAFVEILDCARVWVNGDQPDDGERTHLVPGDEVAILPPVSGG